MSGETGHRRYRYYLVLLLILAIHSGLLAWSATRHSPTVDEVGHLPAGISHLKYGDFSIYRVNPPLVRTIAAIPVVLSDPVLDWTRYDRRPTVRPEWGVGPAFIANNGEKSFWYFTIARWACIPFSLLGAFVCFRWADELYGGCAGLLAATLWCFSPNILAHASMITPDAGGAACGVLAAWLFWRWLRDPTWVRAFFGGIGLGIAELTKATWVVLFPLWIILWLIWRFVIRKREIPNDQVRSFCKQLGQLTLALSIGLYLLNAGYGFAGSMAKLGEFNFVSEALAGPLADPGRDIGNRFRGTWLGDVPVPVPKEFLSGVDVQKGDFERGMRSYLRGEWQQGGWWYYYIYAMLVKVPVGTWTLFLLAIYITFRKSDSSSTWLDELVLFAPPIVVFVLVSSQTGFTNHLRYVLPVFPFVFIFMGKLGASFEESRSANSAGGESLPTTNSYIVCVALLLSIGSSLWVYPHSLSYFNELAGGPMNGHKHLVDSNIDWGQDLLYLKEWYDQHREARPLHLAYFGVFDPHTSGFEYKLPPARPRPGWYAVSVNFMQGMEFNTWDGAGQRQRISDMRYTYFQEFTPIQHVGYSIYIYHVTYEDAQRVRKELGYPPLPPRK